jgi:Flp pilus assembly pilin Flp
MSKFLGLAQRAVSLFRKDESGQDALEYLLVIGVVMVVVVGLVVGGFQNSLVTNIFTDIGNEITALISGGASS